MSNGIICEGGQNVIPTVVHQDGRDVVVFLGADLPPTPLEPTTVQTGGVLRTAFLIQCTKSCKNGNCAALTHVNNDYVGYCAEI